MCIPPGRNAQLSPRPSAALKERNRNVRSINKLGRREWPKRTGYSRRAMVENTIYRYKTIIGRAMTSRTLVGQRVEVRLGLPGSQHDDPARHARQLPSGVTPSRGTGDLSRNSEPCTNASP